MNADFASSNDSFEAFSKTITTTITATATANSSCGSGGCDDNTNNKNNDSSSTLLRERAAKSVEYDAANDSVNKEAKDNNTFNRGKRTKVITNKNQILQHQVRLLQQQQQPNYLYKSPNNSGKVDDDAAVETSANQLNEASLASINRISNSITTCLTTSTELATTTTTTTTSPSAGDSPASHSNSLIKFKINNKESKKSSRNLKLCNICHQEILATKTKLDLLQNQQLEGNNYSNLNSHFYLNPFDSSKSPSNNLPSAQYCQKCVLNAQPNCSSSTSGSSRTTTIDLNKARICLTSEAADDDKIYQNLAFKRAEEAEEDNYSKHFWKFISNLPKSITQRRKSSSSLLNQEVIGYLERKRLERERELEGDLNFSNLDYNNNYNTDTNNKEQRFASNKLTTESSASSGISEQTSNSRIKENRLKNYSSLLLDQIGGGKDLLTRQETGSKKKKKNNNYDNKQASLGKELIKTKAMICSRGDKGCGGNTTNTTTSSTTTTTTKPLEQQQQQQININSSALKTAPAIVESIQLRETTFESNEKVRGDLLYDGSQNQPAQQRHHCQQPTAANELLNECNLSINSKRLEQQHSTSTKQQANKLSIATTLTTRSSVSSLSSCILSSSSTSEVRLKWGKKMDFLLSIIGFAVDLANIWRFPYLVYKNGGGVFFIPYTIMLIFGGIPLFFLELCLGQFVKKGPITVWNKICPSMKGVGYCSILVSWYVSFYYNVLIAWSVYFIYRSVLSFGDKMPWEDCDNSWNSKATCVSISQLKELCAVKNDTLEHCRKELFSSVNVTSPAAEFFVKELSQLDQSNGFDHMGYLRPELVVCLLIVYLLHFMSLFRGLETSGKVVWVTATAPYIILSILLVRGLFLPGARMGIEYYLSPKLERLNDPQVWIDAAGQVFYSIGVGFGVHLTYASFNSHNNNCHRDCLMTSAVNAITSAYSGLVVFVYLGYMAQNLGIEIDKVASEGYSLIFEVYPEALTTLPFARFWSILFFIMLLTLGIDSAMGGLESVITGLEDEFKFAKRLSRGQLTGLVIVSSFFPALLSCTQGGAYTIFWFDIYSAGVSLLFSALFETIGVVYFYGLKKFIPNIESMLGRKPHLFYIICWKYISPLFLSGVIIMSIYTATVPVYRNYTFPLWSIVLGWALAFSSVAAVPLFAIGYWISNWHKKLLDSPEKRKRDRNSASSSSRKSPNRRPVSVSCGNYAQGGNSGVTTTTTTSILNYQQNML